MNELPSRDEALGLLHEYTQGAGLRKHAYAVECAMRAHARRLGEPEEAFGLVGLLHDFDYERWPSLDDHPFRGSEILERLGYPEWFRRAILSHGDHTKVARTTGLEKCLFAVDELCGFVTACTLVLPSKALADLKYESVKKRMKDKAFARSVNRDDIVNGAAAIRMTVEDHIVFVVDAMRASASALGL
ncbi:MAG TPA: HD domain-containing protein [Candidatus Polarisedimenticolaceae bacterium]|nr:HD domain-containing protein [Candidatus Polarisedimenticolaceae bacterium]